MVVARCFRGAWWTRGLAQYRCSSKPCLRGVPRFLCHRLQSHSACHESSLDGSRVIPRDYSRPLFACFLASIPGMNPACQIE
jgi:hypothetical protein